MPQDKVQLLRGVYERWREGDFSAGVELFDPLILFIMRPEFPDAGNYLGLDRVAEYMRGFLEPWTRLTIEAEDYFESGDSIAVAVRQRGTGGESGAPTELRYFQVWSFRGDRVIRLENIRERTDAMATVGLSGQA
jgi:ketosteroid isomerase-like protein